MNNIERISDNILKSTSKIIIEYLEKEINYCNKYKDECTSKEEFKGYINGVENSISIIKNISGIS